MNLLKVILKQAWRDESGRNYLPDSILSLPEVVGFSLVAGGIADLFEDVEISQRQSRVFKQDRVAAFTAQPRKIRKFN